MADESDKRPRPLKPKKPIGRGDIIVSIGEDEPAPPAAAELARWTGDLMLAIAPEEAGDVAADILLAARNARKTGNDEALQVWLQTSTVRIYKPE